MRDLAMVSYGQSMRVRCSDMTLSDVKDFFTFQEKVVQLPKSTLDLSTFHYCNVDIVGLDATMVPQDSKYAWIGDKLLPWELDEKTWYTRLFHSLREATQTFSGIDIILAYTWEPKTYERKVGELFNIVKAAFNGMTDIIFKPQKAAPLAVVEVGEEIDELGLCCIEVGSGTTSPSLLSVGVCLMNLPEKLGELLASMHCFGTRQFKK